MADVKSESKVSVELSGMDKLYVIQALALYEASLRRSRTKEILGSDIYVLRSRELDAVASLRERVNSAKV